MDEDCLKSIRNPYKFVLCFNFMKPKLTKLFDYMENGSMRIAGMMSGEGPNSGSNLLKIIQYQSYLKTQRGISPYEVAVIFTDNANSNAFQIGKKYDIPVICRDKKGFYGIRGQSTKNLELREEFDEENVQMLKSRDIHAAAYAGYMSIATDPLIEAFLGINVHPADLSVMENKKRKYTGDHAVRDAILAGEKYIKSTTHIIDKEVDHGKILMISKPLEVILDKDFNQRDEESLKKAEKLNQDKLKQHGDWVIFPMTLLFIADGRYAKDDSGNLYFDGKAIPNGLVLGSSIEQEKMFQSFSIKELKYQS
jgi:folate-dependent phosphoribosylglycinamide formyltransferase PurN